jgi:flavorubredoxin
MEGFAHMKTDTHEIAPNIFRLSTLVPDITADGFSFNQFLIRAEEPMLFHCGPRAMFPLVSEAVRRLIDLNDLRWISFGHVESDECGSMNQWLAAAPHAQVMHGQTACDVSLNDLADRPPRVLLDNELVDLGGKRARFLYTPHVPHGWDAGVFMEETTNTLLCGDLFTHAGNGPAIVESDVVGPAAATERMFQSMSMAPNTRPTLERLAALQPRVLAIMHGSSFSGDGAKALSELATALT